MAQEDPAAASVPVGESAPGFPPQRDPETPAAGRVPPQRPEADDRAGPDPETENPDTPGAAGSADVAGATEAADVAQAARPAAAPVLGDRERAVLDFERKRWKHAGAKEQAVRDVFDLSATRYYQLLNALLDDPAALAYAPALVGRLRRIRDSRQQARH